MNQATLNEALKRAWALREEFRDKGEFTTAPYRNALGESLRDLPGADDDLLDSIAHLVDWESCYRLPAADDQWHMAGEYRISATGRIAKRLALLEHMEADRTPPDAELLGRN
jgi:hypothetical protein